MHACRVLHERSACSPLTRRRHVACSHQVADLTFFPGGGSAPRTPPGRAPAGSPFGEGGGGPREIVEYCPRRDPYRAVCSKESSGPRSVLHTDFRTHAGLVSTVTSDRAATVGNPFRKTAATWNCATGGRFPFRTSAGRN